MEVEKRGLKGGFLQLLDWNRKSRKKLFSNKSELSESSSLQKENLHSSIALQGLQKGDSEYGAKAPGVVARLMGLDSLPKSNDNGTCLTSFTESQLCADSSYLMDAPAFEMEHDVVIFERVAGKLDGLNKNPLDLNLQKAHGRPIGRFQTEVLPPKSARPISITHHPLLSPIKSPGFVPSKNAACIIEGAAKIIEQSPRSTTKGNFQALGSGSVPLRIFDLREKMDAAQRSSRLVSALEKGKEQRSMKNRNRNRGRSENSYLHKGSEVSKIMASQSLMIKEKSACPAAQAMDNVRKRDGLASVSKRSSEKQKEHNDVKPVCVARNRTNSQKKVEKHNLSRKHSEILRLNNKKQNCALSKGAENFEPSCLHSKESKELSAFNNNVQEMSRTVTNISADNVVTSRKTNFVAADSGKELSASRAKTMSKKKMLTNGNTQPGGSVAQKVTVSDAKTAKSNRKAKWEEVDKKRSLDVVSFTFSSPVKKSGSNSGGKILQASTFSSFQKCDPRPNESDTSSAMSTSGFNPIAGDFLSVLLEQKLKELTSRIELSQNDMSEAGFSSSVNSYGKMGSPTTVTKPLTMDGKCKTEEEIQNACGYPPVYELWHNAENNNKGPVPASIQQMFSGASSGSLDVNRGSSSEVEYYEETSRSSTGKSCVAEGDLDISDSASSHTIGASSETALHATDSKHHSCWELKYINNILSSAQFLLEEFALGQAHKIITPGLFDHLENHIIESYTSTEDQCVLERKVLFDCVCECLDVRWRQVISGSCTLWHMHMTMLLRRREWLAEDLYREISNWMNGQQLSTDEVVDKDMSRKDGKWMEFEIEAFEEGVEVEKGILSSLVDELIDDFLFC